MGSSLCFVLVSGLLWAVMVESALFCRADDWGKLEGSCRRRSWELKLVDLEEKVASQTVKGRLFPRPAFSQISVNGIYGRLWQSSRPRLALFVCGRLAKLLFFRPQNTWHKKNSQRCFKVASLHCALNSAFPNGTACIRRRLSLSRRLDARRQPPMKAPLFRPFSNPSAKTICPRK